MYTSSMHSQWLGPSWHQAFHTFAVAKQVCTKSVVVGPMKQAKEDAMDAIYGKAFLDDLQESVISGSYKHRAATNTKTHSRTARFQRKQRQPVIVHVSDRQPGPQHLGQQHGRKGMRLSRDKRQKLSSYSIPESVCTEGMLTFQRRVEESKEFVKHLKPLYPSNVKHVTPEKAAETVYDAKKLKAYYITSNSLVAH